MVHDNRSSQYDPFRFASSSEQLVRGFTEPIARSRYSEFKLVGYSIQSHLGKISMVETMYLDSNYSPDLDSQVTTIRTWITPSLKHKPGKSTELETHAADFITNSRMRLIDPAHLAQELSVRGALFDQVRSTSTQARTYVFNDDAIMGLFFSVGSFSFGQFFAPDSRTLVTIATSGEFIDDRFCTEDG